MPWLMIAARLTRIAARGYAITVRRGASEMVGGVNGIKVKAVGCGADTAVPWRARARGTKTRRRRVLQIMVPWPAAA